MQTLMTEPSTPQAATAPVLDDSQRVRCEVWTRVMGYHRPVSSFNTGKQGEFNERRFFVEPAPEAAAGPGRFAPAHRARPRHAAPARRAGAAATRPPSAG